MMGNGNDDDDDCELVVVLANFQLSSQCVVIRCSYEWNVRLSFTELFRLPAYNSFLRNVFFCCQTFCNFNMSGFAIYRKICIFFESKKVFLVFPRNVFIVCSKLLVILCNKKTYHSPQTYNKFPAWNLSVTITKTCFRLLIGGIFYFRPFCICNFLLWNTNYYSHIIAGGGGRN